MIYTVRSLLSLGLILLFIWGMSHAKSVKDAIVCDGHYVLCNAAPCQQIPGEKGRALCECSRWEGKNIGYSSCQQRQPQTGEYRQVKLLSTFSLGGMHYKYMTCNAGTPWTNCLDQECLVDKHEPRKAHCNCKIEHSTPYVTFAGSCDTAYCYASIWSAALPQDNLDFIKTISTAVGMQKPPTRACPLPQS
jgi:hypothetical protein